MLRRYRIDCGSVSRSLRELKIGEALNIARIPYEQNERRLTAFLAGVLDDEALARALTVQERYHLLIEYLATSSDTALAVPINFNLYRLRPDQPDRRWKTSVQTQHGQIQQLCGWQAELLESVCEDVADWLIGSLVLQCQQPEFAAMPTDPQATDEQRLAVLVSRVKAFEALPQRDAEALTRSYLQANQDMAYHLKTNIDAKGITILPANGGADDAPARFRPDTAFGWLAQRLAGFLDVPDQRVGA